MRLKTRLMFLVDRLLLAPAREFWRRCLPHPQSTMAQVKLKAFIDSANFIESHLGTALLFTNRLELMSHAAAQVSGVGTILEFGVYKGESLDYLAHLLPKSRIVGFDSFQGLKENWSGTERGARAFDVEGQRPRVQKNCELVAGWFDQSLPPWLESNSDAISLIHVDSDTYGACRTILELLQPRMNSKTLILFDEHQGYPGWKHGESKALEEFLRKNNWSCTFLGFSEMAALVQINTHS